MILGIVTYFSVSLFLMTVWLRSFIENEIVSFLNSKKKQRNEINERTSYMLSNKLSDECLLLLLSYAIYATKISFIIFNKF